MKSRGRVARPLLFGLRRAKSREFNERRPNRRHMPGSRAGGSAERNRDPRMESRNEEPVQPFRS
jgi:hypothetical protein